MRPGNHYGRLPEFGVFWDPGYALPEFLVKIKNSGWQSLWLASCLPPRGPSEAHETKDRPTTRREKETKSKPGHVLATCGNESDLCGPRPGHECMKRPTGPGCSCCRQKIHHKLDGSRLLTPTGGHARASQILEIAHRVPSTQQLRKHRDEDDQPKYCMQPWSQQTMDPCPMQPTNHRSS